MSSSITITELRSMSLPDLLREIRSQRSSVRKMRLQITMNTEKDTARYRREKKALARMLTVLTTKGKEPLKDSAKVATVSVSKKPKKASGSSS